ncbi:RbtT/DalT/CsbX family MFS transporter [Leifsonia sp. NCR5]|uniref:RbtT/DalT/CsbX family MFS transporter n=1 Tax=Leifsonia sp. NCR5 TaxID=1978342 RepID=UPI000A192E75|nr:RbtT/DalT/CsbX family MFS transporter [Leifsonia sp. NCR5]
MTTTTVTTTETFLDRIGIPHPLRWGFLGVLVFMTGNGVESNFLSPHMTEALGGNQLVLVAQIIAMYSLAVLIASYLSGALADLWGPRRVMTLGFVAWVVFEIAFLVSLSMASVPLMFVSYFLRGFGFPLFAFAFLVWINQVAPKKRAGTAVGWFYVMFTGGLPTLGSLFAVFVIPAFGGGYHGETWTMIASIGLVLIGWAIARFCVKEAHGARRLADPADSTAKVLSAGIVLTARNPRILMGFLIRLINTAPEFGMFIVLPAIVADSLGWGQSRWLIMTVVIFAGNIAFNAVFGAIGDRMGWVRTVRWFGIVGSSIGLLLWWYVPHWVPAGSDWGFVVATIAGTVFGIMLAGFVPMGAIMPALVPQHKGAAMAMYTTAAGGATFLGSAVVALALPLWGPVGVVWTFVALYACAFVMIGFLKVDQHRDDATAAPAFAEAGAR